MDLRDTGPFALAGVRRWATGQCSHLGADHLADVLLVVDELVANAYAHGGGPLRARITAMTRPCRVVVEVDDVSSAHPHVHPPTPEVDHACGYGMFLIDELADTWGVHENHDSGGKTVWARLSCGTALEHPAADNRRQTHCLDDAPNFKGTIRREAIVWMTASTVWDSIVGGFPAPGRGPNASSCEATVAVADAGTGERCRRSATAAVAAFCSWSIRSAASRE
ncbi:ATP-binding protein [Amycolatopsis vastitatis]|nr:ATP-binding protein [Amycolatopsis vastitatis]